MIENLKMKIPWKNLSSKPVVVNLKGLYLLVTPKNKASWKDLEIDLVQKRNKFLISYAKTLMDTI